MAHEIALSVVNTLQDQLSGLARSIVSALADKKISPWEGMSLGMQGMNLATYIVTLLQGMDDATRRQILYVLEHGNIVLPE